MQRGIGRLRAGGGLFNPVALFAGGEQGAHFETYDPQSLLRRRNQLTYSSQFSNAAWTRTRILSVTENADGVGDFVVPNTTSGAHELHQGAASVGVANTGTVRAKAGGYGWIIIQIGNGTDGFAYFNVQSGTLGTNSGVGVPSITAAPDAPGYFDCSLTCPSAAGNSNFFVFAANANGGATFAGDGTSGIYLARAQLEWNTTTPSAYQEVTDWNTEYLAAALESIGMWQDSAGTTATYAVELPVGKWIDKSGRGNHDSQSGSTKRPILTARVNQFLGSAALATQNVTTAAASYVLSFTGSGSITLSGTATGTYSAGTNTITATAGTLTATVTGTVTLADLRTADDAAKNIPAYQRVNTSTDYDTDGFVDWSKFDGLDDNQTTSGGGGGAAGFLFCAAVTLSAAGTSRVLWSDMGTNTGYRVMVNTSNQLQLTAGNGTASTSISTVDTIAAESTHVVTAWDDGTNLNVQIDNGTIASVGRPVVSAGTSSFTIGSSNGAASGYLNGRIYDLTYRQSDCGDYIRSKLKQYHAGKAGIIL